MTLLVYYLAFAVASFYALWVFYLAVMNLKRARNAGLLTPTARALGLPVLFAGYLLDCTVNVFVMTLVLLELPRETTVTARLKRHHRESDGWRLAVALWFEPILDPYDPSGDHV